MQDYRLKSLILKLRKIRFIKLKSFVIWKAFTQRLSLKFRQAVRKISISGHEQNSGRDKTKRQIRVVEQSQLFLRHTKLKTINLIIMECRKSDPSRNVTREFLSPLIKLSANKVIPSEQNKYHKNRSKGNSAYTLNSEIENGLAYPNIFLSRRGIGPPQML